MTALNDYQRQTILSGFRDIHHRLADMEAQLVQSLLDSPFTQYVNDLSPTERKVIQDYFGRIRESLRTCLHEAGIPLEARRTSLRWVLQGGLIFLDSAVSELAAERLIGYGELSAEGRAQAERIQQELHRLIARAAAYLRQGLGHDLGQRLARLDAAPADAKQLQVLDGILTRRGLVEFRPLLEQIVRRLEEPRFEIAVFGRVSSGKSSLLNHVAGGDVLPVGVLPITAVPARLLRGEPARAAITFAEQQPRTVVIEELREYASEEGNPGNRKHVVGIEVFTPSPRLREGVVLVDTPGIGSLARSGSAETFAYLPRCDLGVVLIDAAANVNDDDLTLLRLLAEAGVPFQVLLSKADLLTPEQRRQAAEYVQAQVKQELELDAVVHPVSIVGAGEKLLHHWFEQEIEPLLARARVLAEQSLRRKIAYLRESVAASLETLSSGTRKESGNGRANVEEQRLRQLLEEADRAIHEARERCRDWTADEPALRELVLDNAVGTLLSSRAKAPNAAVGEAARQVLAQRGRTAHELVVKLRQFLVGILESLHPSAPRVRSDTSAVRDLTFFRGLPTPELPPLEAGCLIGSPWWSAILPNLARWSTRRRLEETLGAALREQLELRDRQIQAWLKQSLTSLIEAYENQAEIFRTQVQRANEPVKDAGREADTRGVAEDLQALRQA